MSDKWIDEDYAVKNTSGDHRNHHQDTDHNDIYDLDDIDNACGKTDVEDIMYTRVAILQCVFSVSRFVNKLCIHSYRFDT